MMSDKDFSLGDKVFAKVKGYPPWPATVSSIKEIKLGKRYNVTFYGTQETSNYLKIDDLYPYREHKDKLLDKYARKRDFLESVQELEDELNAVADHEEEESSKENGKINTELADSVEALKSKKPAKTISVVKGTKRTHSSSQSSEEYQPEHSKAKKPNLSVSRKSSTASNASNRKKSIDLSEVEVQQLNTEMDEDENDMEPELEPEKVPREVDHSYTIVFADELYEKIKDIDGQLRKAHAAGDDGPIKEDKRGKKKKLLLARSHTGEFIGLKYDMDRPDLFENEMARVQWTLSSIRNILRYKSQVERGEVVPRSSDVVNSPNLTPEERILAIEKCVVKRKQERLAWLQTESKLVECDSEIKSHLGLEKANPELALACLEKIAVLNIEQLMLTKHPHVVDMVKRLRRYIGNVKQWNLSPEKTAEFIQGAEKIRKKADVVYQKFKNLYELHPEKTFTDVYMGHVEEFNTQTKHMREAAKFAVCAKPGTHQFEMDQLDDKMESDAIKLKSQLEKKRLHIETDDQHELEDYET